MVASPTFPAPYGTSIIGHSRLNFRIRNGNGCFPTMYGDHHYKQ